MVVQRKRPPGRPPDYGKGAFSGFTEFRYGEDLKGRKPYLSENARRIFKGDRLQHLVARTADLLEPWRFSKWEKEGATLAGLRNALVEAGYPFSKSEVEAEDIVRRAFNKLGRGQETRPAGIEGQDQYTVAREQCLWCRGDLDDEAIAAKAKFCSDVCRNSARERNAYLTTWATEQETKAAWTLARIAAAPERHCVVCDKVYRSPDPDTKTCSPKCASRSRTDIQFHQEQPCEHCGTMFRPSLAGQKFCSRRCSDEHQKTSLPEQPCEHCGTIYQPTKPHQRFCGDTCASRAYHARRKAEKELGIVWDKTRQCLECGTMYEAPNSLSKFCSPGCKTKYTSRERTRKRAEARAKARG